MIDFREVLLLKCRIYVGYYDREKIVANFACYHGTRLMVRSSNMRGWDKIKGGIIILLQKMKIWCKIQVIIYPLLLIKGGIEKKKCL